VKALHSERINACLDLISKALRGELRSREDLVLELERIYSQRGVEPIRGRTKINIFDKEVCTVYVVAKYGLGLDPDEYKDFYEKFLNAELRAERAAERLLAGEGERAVAEEMGVADENTVFRIARLEATAVLMGFKSEERLSTLLARLEEAFPQLTQKIQGFKRFFIAFTVAQAIAVGKVTTRFEKETLKHALCIKLNASKAAPSDDLIGDIAINVLGASERLVYNALSLKHQPY